MLESLCNNVSGLQPATLLEKNFDTGVFLWILENFSEQLFAEHLHVRACEGYIAAKNLNGKNQKQFKKHTRFQNIITIHKATNNT